MPRFRVTHTLFLLAGLPVVVWPLLASARLQTKANTTPPLRPNASPAGTKEPPARAAATPPAAPAASNWRWIWAADGPKPDETIRFRQTIRLPKAPLSARLLITADDSYQAWLNDSKTPIAEANDWTTVQEYDVTRALKAGDNLLAISVRNTGGPGGLLYKLTVKTSPTKTLTFVSDNQVRASRNPPPAWKTLGLDDKRWSLAQEVAKPGEAPWGALRGAPVPDFTRLVRLWDIRAGGSGDDDPYTRQRNVGDRMLLSASVSTQSDMQLLNGVGFTLFQTDSDHLSTEETGPNQWDFRSADSARQAVQKLGLDWCYFPHYAFPPPWYRDSTPFTRLQCLEHNEPVQAFSLWEPKWAGFIDHGYDALAKEFNSPNAKIKNRKSVEALYVGIHGDYGEAGLMSGARVHVPGQTEDWQRRFGNLHDHLGYWCADPLARQDFRNEMLKQYGSLQALNMAWHRQYQKPEDITYPAIPSTEPAVEDRRAWLDFIAWYQGAVGHAIELNLRSARTRFPDTLLMLPAGFGDEDPRGGNDNSLIPKLAAKYKAEVRSTHGRYKPFADNAASMLGRLGSASRFYGAPFWTEPPGNLKPSEEVERIFESVSQGSVGYFDWASNAVNNRDVYYRYGKYLRVEKPIVDVAMFYPAEAQRLRTNQPSSYTTFTRACAYLRDVGNYDIVDDRMVRDGCLAGYRVLVLWEGTLASPETLAKIKQWVNEGGVLLAYDFGKVRTFDNDDAWFQDLFGYYKELKPASVTERYRGGIPRQYRISVGETEQADYLGDTWYDPETIDADTKARWTGDRGSVRLPIDPEKHYTLVVRAYLPPEAGELKHEVFLAGKQRSVKLGDLSSTGDVTYRLPLPEGVLGSSNLTTITFQSGTFPSSKLTSTGQETKDSKENKDVKPARNLGVRIQYVQLIEQGSSEAAEVLPPPAGWYANWICASSIPNSRSRNKVGCVCTAKD